MHPLLSFANPRQAAARIASATFALSGEARAIARARQLVRALHARSIHLHDGDKPLYHAAAVFGANYLVANMVLACDLMARVGIREAEARRLLSPLALGVIADAAARGARHALSGPIARGDATTVRAHIAALPTASFRRLYSELGRVVLDLADISPAARSRVRRAFRADS
jgi:predicted short-subunit dehydrogenase-like oxidoreductase (DUF2520 family)